MRKATPVKKKTRLVPYRVKGKTLYIHPEAKKLLERIVIRKSEEVRFRKRAVAKV